MAVMRPSSEMERFKFVLGFWTIKGVECGEDLLGPSSNPSMFGNTQHIFQKKLAMFASIAHCIE